MKNNCIIPYSLAYRIVRICSDRQILLSRLEELKNLLLSRDYHPKVVNAAIERALKVPRETALKKVEAASTERVVFVTDFHPALPSISSILCKSWRIMIKDPYLKEVFPEPPLVAYRKPKNSSLREMLVKSKVPEEMPTRSQRQTNGTKKCRKSGCMCCPFLQEGNTVTSTASNFTHKIKQSLTCATSNVIYRITCLKGQCNGLQYVGETGRPFKQRLADHIGYIRSERLDQPVGQHFNLPGHNLGHLEATIIEKCKLNSPLYRKTREAHFINIFASKYKGLNRKT